MSKLEDLYQGREQTEAKHFLLRNYLYALTFKILSRRDEISYVDGFSGPWESKSESFADTSFGIAMDVLLDCQKYFRDRGKHKTIRCFLVEADKHAFRQLQKAASKLHSPDSGFHVRTHRGEFEYSISEIIRFIGESFSLTFIDPTGWTGYSFTAIQKLLAHKPGEIFVNFMYDYVNRFCMSEDKRIESSLDPILGGPGWRERLDKDLPKGKAVEKLFRSELRKAGEFEFVVSTCIQKSTMNRPHYFIAYATRHIEGLITFRKEEYRMMRKYETRRISAKEKNRSKNPNQVNLFPDEDLPIIGPPEESVDFVIDIEKKEARDSLLAFIRERSSAKFDDVVALLLQQFMLRATDVKEICIELAHAGEIRNSWRGTGRLKPNSQDIIALTPDRRAGSPRDPRG